MFGKDEKMMAKMDALKGMSNSLKENSRKPMGEELNKKKMEKIVIEAPDKKGLLEGLSKAEELIKAKFGSMGLDDKAMGDHTVDMGDDEEMEGSCPICGDSMEDMHEHEE